jgi:hypothetical protein
MRLEMDMFGIMVRLKVKAKYLLSLLPNSQTKPGFHTAAYPTYTRVFPGVNQVGHEKLIIHLYPAPR